MSDPPARSITDRRLRRFRKVLQQRHEDLVVVLENVHDPHNASAILRSCDGFGVGRIALVYTNQVFPEISRGVAAQVEKWLQIERYDTAEACVEALHSAGHRVYATRLTEDADDYLSVDWREPSAIVLGNEHAGCSDEMVALSDGAVIIPMQGFAQSLNVSVAAAVILAETARQRRGQAPVWTDAKAAQEAAWIARESPLR